MKKKLFIWCDSPSVKTGFGVVASNLFRDLHKHYEVGILGINYFGIHRYDTSRYFIYPTDTRDLFGMNRIGKVLEDFKPDGIILFQDIFNIDIVLPTIKKIKKEWPILGYFPIDGSPVSKSWIGAFQSLNKVITYTKWGIRSIKEAHPELKDVNIEYLYHGVDTEVFKPLPQTQIMAEKVKRNWHDKFLIVSINRFQPRKHISQLVRIHALFTKGYKECKCGNVYLASKEYCDLNQCPATDVVGITPGHDDALLYLHANTQERMMGPGRGNLLQSHMVNAGFQNQDVNKTIAAFAGNVYSNPVSEEDLNIIYNIGDVNVSTTLGEGVGLSLVEASAAGTTTIAPNNSSIPEMLGDTGHRIRNDAFVSIALDHGHFRPVMSAKHFLQALEVEYEKWRANEKQKVVNQATIDRVNELFLWQDKREKFLGWIQEYV